MLINGSPEVLRPVKLGGLSATSTGYEYATQAGGIGADQYYANIANYVSNVLATAGMTDAEKAANIAAAAAEYGVSNEDIAKATGYTQTQVENYLAPVVSASTQTTVIETAPASEGYTYATQAGGVGANQYYANIASYVSDVLNDATMTDTQRAAKIAAAAAEYGVSLEDIAKATGYTIQQVNDFIALATTDAITKAAAEQAAAQAAAAAKAAAEQAAAQAAAAAKVAAEQAAAKTAAAAKAAAEQAAAQAAAKADAAAKAAAAAAAVKAAQDAIAAANAAAAAKTADAAAKAAAAQAAIKAAQDATAKANAAKATATTTTTATTTATTTTTGTAIEKALPLVLAAAAAYFLGT